MEFVIMATARHDLLQNAVQEMKSMLNAKTSLAVSVISMCLSCNQPQPPTSASSSSATGRLAAITIESLR
jgi:hypothetical protein